MLEDGATLMCSVVLKLSVRCLGLLWPDSCVVNMAGAEAPDVKVKLEQLEALAAEAVNDPTKFGRLLNAAVISGATAAAVGPSGVSDTFLQDVAYMAGNLLLPSVALSSCEDT